MKSVEKILIDTSVWIDYFRGITSSVADKMDEILSENTVCVPKIVMAELIQGAKTTKEISVILDFFDAFNVIDQKEESWINAGKLSYELKKKRAKYSLGRLLYRCHRKREWLQYLYT